MANTITDLFLEQVTKNGDAPALHARSGEEWVTTTWREYGAAVRAMALALDSRGVTRGGSVAVISGSLPQYFVADIGTAAIGAKTASIYQTNTPEQMLYVLRNSDATIILCEDDTQVAKAEQLRDDVEGLLIVNLTERAGDLTYSELIAEGAELDDAEPSLFSKLMGTVETTDPACVIYTSGTTGPPKAALIPHASILTVLKAVVEGWSTEGEYRAVSYLPLAHIAERVMSLYSQLSFGGQVWFSNVTNLAADLSSVHPTRFLAVPRVWEKFEEKLRPSIPDPTAVPAENLAGLRAMLGFDKLEIAFSGAAPISEETLRYFENLGVPILEVYGMTETTGLSTANPVGAAKIGTVGKAVPGVEVAIAGDGEILIRGANFGGYLKNADATAEALEDGWMHTGDLGGIDDEGYITISGRKKDLIITAGGENVAPNNIQLLLTRSPYISQAVAIGDRRRFISALVTLSEETVPTWAQANGLGDLSMEKLAEHPLVAELIATAVAEANEHLARVSQVREYRILGRDFSLEAGELTPTMKLKRNVIETDYSDVIEAIYAM